MYQKNYTKIMVFALLLILNVHVKAQNKYGIIKGHVTTSDGKAAEYVTIGLKGTNKGTYVDKNGNYSLKNVEPGNYFIEARFVGLETKAQSADVKGGEISVVDFIMNENNEKLQEVIVSGYKTNTFARKETEHVARLPITNLENPQVYNVVSKEIMQEQIVSDYKSAFKNIPGASVGQSHSSNGRYMNTTRGFNLGNSARNGLGTSSVAEIDPANLERIEAIKGPSGTLFGASLSTFGGLYNRVTKKPLEDFRGQVSYTTGSFNLHRLTSDVNIPLNPDKSILLRVNTALHSEKSFQDAGFSKTYMFAPVISIKATNRLSFLVDLELYGRKGTNIFANNITAGKVSAKSADQLNIDYKKSFTNNSVVANTRTQNAYMQANYKISDEWLSQTSLQYSVVEFEFPALTLTTISDSMLTRNIWDQYTRQVTSQIQQNFIGDFKIAGFRNRVVAGIDLSNMNFDFPNTRSAVLDTVNYLRNDPNYPKSSINEIENKIAGVKLNSGSKSKYYNLGAYVSDVFNISKNLMLMLSLRVDRYNSDGSYSYGTDKTTGVFKQNALSPKLGIVYQPFTNKVSIFANYMNGFQFVAPVNQPDATISNFKPQYANQLEAGVKLEILKNKISSTLSYYDIVVSNMVRADMERDPVNGQRFQIQDGNQNSRGFDAEIIANPVAGLNIVIGYAYNESKMTKANENVNGRRPTNSGAYNTGNVWLSYKLSSGVAKGLGVGAGLNYSGEQMVINNTTARFTVPEYTVFDASLFYDQVKYRIGLKADNISNTKYWSTALAPQTPCRISANLTLKF